MESIDIIKQKIFDPSINFKDKVDIAFNHQLKYNPLYTSFCQHLYPNTNPLDVTKIPFLPIEFFRNHLIIDQDQKSQQIFESSGTTNSNNSRHAVADLLLYKNSIVEGFEHFYGSINDYIIFPLLPSYIERSNASLVFMVNYLMEMSGQDQQKFYGLNYEDFIQDVAAYNGPKKKFIIGVTFALWELAELEQNLDFSDCIVSETGGMKGKKKEVLREQLHDILCPAFKVPTIHSEYGMTELLSQAYSLGQGIFHCPPWMHVYVRDPYDPTIVKRKGRGIINIIDLANFHSCPFIATNDLGEIFDDGSFKIIGRVDNSRLRGCNLMYAG